MTLLLIATFALFASTGLADPLAWKMALRGRVVFPQGPRTPVECDGVLEVLLQDTSMADAPAQTVARYLGKAIEFPMHFALKYDPEELLPGQSYSLRISIKNKKNELLYTNDAYLGVTPVGEERTTFIDTPVILVKRVERKTQWPELVGQTGEEAVRVIKEETGRHSFDDRPITSPLRFT